MSKILYTFATAFRRSPKSPSSLPELISDANQHRFNVALEFKEEDGKGGYSTSPKDKNVFKLRCDLEKKLVITVSQLTQGRELQIERCSTRSLSYQALAFLVATEWCHLGKSRHATYLKNLPARRTGDCENLPARIKIHRPSKY